MWLVDYRPLGIGQGFCPIRSGWILYIPLVVPYVLFPVALWGSLVSAMDTPVESSLLISDVASSLPRIGGHHHLHPALVASWLHDSPSYCSTLSSSSFAWFFLLSSWIQAVLSEFLIDISGSGRVVEHLLGFLYWIVASI